MAVPKPQRPKGGSPQDVRAAQEYMDQLLASEQGNLSPDEIDSLRDSVSAIRQGEMSLEDFERKYGL